MHHATRSALTLILILRTSFSSSEYDLYQPLPSCIPPVWYTKTPSRIHPSVHPSYVPESNHVSCAYVQSWRLSRGTYAAGIEMLGFPLWEGEVYDVYVCIRIM